VAQQREELEQARVLHREADRHANILKDRLSGHERETEGLRTSVRALQLRLGSVRKLLQQASSSLGEPDEATDAVVIEAPSPATELAPCQGPPPLATPAGNAVKPGMSLADLEAQAQRELRQLNHKGGALFKGRAKS
jgi:hypothetical protein